VAKADPVLKDLKAAAKGLLFPSEMDAAVEAFAWKGVDGPPSEGALRANAEVEEDAPVEQLTLAELAWTIPEEGRGAFLPLFAALAHHLSGVTVFKVGEVEADVYIIGRTTDGRFAGVKTKVVET
jgi:hypothetical protein